MATVFTRVISGELPGTFVWRDERCVAFLSINPLSPGHTLVVPIDEIDHWLDVPPDTQAHLFDIARRIGEAQMRAFRPERIGLVIAGFEVPHCHLHVCPVNSLADMDFAHALPMVSPEQLHEPAEAIRAELAALT
ncbi:HIT family protein [Candidatus Poriferisodalis sp.]|uniref:HIT family protein n=1 Tax=Candidatus Poriferisodalis sp. TaxID=3101277 RepID=UPI003B0132E9